MRIPEEAHDQVVLETQAWMKNIIIAVCRSNVPGIKAFFPVPARDSTACGMPAVEKNRGEPYRFRQQK